MNKNWLKKIILFVLMAAVMFGLVQYRSANDFDKDFAKINLAEGKTVHYTVDLGKEGSLKYLLQPNIYTVYFRLHTADKNVKLSCASEGVTMMLAQSSKKGVWRELESRQLLRRDRGSLPLNVEIYLPREAVKQYHVAQGRIKFYDGKKEYAAVLVDIVNSRYK